jgi:hypothetical protein
MAFSVYFTDVLMVPTGLLSPLERQLQQLALTAPPASTAHAETRSFVFEGFRVGYRIDRDSEIVEVLSLVEADLAP